MMIKELKFPRISFNEIEVGYGGNQEWFHRFWQRMAGCGCIAGTNLAAYYASVDADMTKLYHGNSQVFNQLEYVKAMGEMFRYMKPNLFGFPFIKKFAVQFVKYCKERKVSMEARVIMSYQSPDEAYRFVKECIDSGNPVALLILFHRATQLKDDNWHWMTITGYSETDSGAEKKIIRSNYGKREIIDSDVLFDIHRRNIIRMVSFKKR